MGGAVRARAEGGHDKWDFAQAENARRNSSRMKQFKDETDEGETDEGRNR